MNQDEGKRIRISRSWWIARAARAGAVTAGLALFAVSVAPVGSAVAVGRGGASISAAASMTVPSRPASEEDARTRGLVSVTPPGGPRYGGRGLGDGRWGYGRPGM